MRGAAAAGVAAAAQAGPQGRSRVQQQQGRRRAQSLLAHTPRVIFRSRHTHTLSPLSPFALVSLLSIQQLEKKFSGKHVVLIGQRRILRKPSAGQRQPKQKRPRSRTLTAVHESILEDLVYPTEIVGKHTRYRLDGSKICKVYLDPKEAPNVEYKVDTFATVYKKLTGKEVKFEFPVQDSH